MCVCVCVCERAFQLYCVSLGSLPRIAVLTASYKGLFSNVKNKIKPMSSQCHEDNNFGGSLVWILESEDVTYNPRIEAIVFLGQYN